MVRTASERGDLETGADGRPSKVKMKVKVAGITDEQVVAYTWKDNEVSWELVSSAQQKAQDGKYVLVPKGDSTLVKFDLLADPNVPLPGFVLKRAVKGTIDSATKDLRERVLKVKKGSSRQWLAGATGRGQGHRTRRHRSGSARGHGVGRSGGGRGASAPARRPADARRRP